MYDTYMQFAFEYLIYIVGIFNGIDSLGFDILS